MPAAIAIPAIVGAAGAGASLVGAKMSANASRDAAKLQVQSAEKAQRFTQQTYDDQKAAMQPYMQAGQQSLGALMARYAGQPLQNRFAPGGGQAAEPFQVPQGGGMPQGGQSLAAVGQMPGGPAQPMPQPHGAPSSAMPMQGGGMVRVKAPTGEMAMLPDGSPQLQMALQKGAVRF